MAENEVDKVVKLRKQSQLWFVIQSHDEKTFRQDSYRSFELAKGAELDLVKLGYRTES